MGLRPLASHPPPLVVAAQLVFGPSPRPLSTRSLHTVHSPCVSPSLPTASTTLSTLRSVASARCSSARAPRSSSATSPSCRSTATSRSSRRLTTTARARSLSSSTVASTSAVSSRSASTSLRPRPVSWTTRRPVASTLPARFSVSSTKRLALAYLARCAAGGTRIKKGCRADLPEGPLEGDKRGFVHSPASEQVAGERGLFSLLQNYSFATERIAAFLQK